MITAIGRVGACGCRARARVLVKACVANGLWVHGVWAHEFAHLLPLAAREGAWI